MAAAPPEALAVVLAVVLVILVLSGCSTDVETRTARFAEVINDIFFFCFGIVNSIKISIKTGCRVLGSG